MHHMRSGTPVRAFFEALYAQAMQAVAIGSGWGGYTFEYMSITLPPVPPEPIDMIEKAFYNNVCIPLYNQLAQLGAIGTTVVYPPASNTPVYTYTDYLNSASAP